MVNLNDCLIFKFCVSLVSSGAMQTPEAGADSTSTVPLQTTVPVQPTGSTQQVPVQQQVRLNRQLTVPFHTVRLMAVELE